MAMATRTAVALIVDARLLPVPIVDRSPQESGALLRQTAPTVNAEAEAPTARHYHRSIGMPRGPVSWANMGGYSRWEASFA